MKILSASQIRETDQFTIENEPIASIDLMERASVAFVEWFAEKFSKEKNIVVFCGTGNNGGDGLAIARMLSHIGCKVQVVVVKGSPNKSEDFITNLNRLPESISFSEVQDSEKPQINSNTNVLIDAMLGSGLSRPVEGLYARAIAFVNTLDLDVVSVDIPSGLPCDTEANGIAIEATFTISFEVPKLAFFFKNNAEFVGDWNVGSIGLSTEKINSLQTNYSATYISDCIGILRPRKRHDHKGIYGSGLLVGGSHGKMGAVVLAAKAFMKSGAGLLTCHVPVCGYEILQVTIPESMATVDESSTSISKIPYTAKHNAVGIGPGLGQDKATSLALENFLRENESPLVIDADALNILSNDLRLMELIPAGSVITPHLKEFERIVGKSENESHRWEQAAALAQKYGIIVVLKGANTGVFDPFNKVYFNTSGNPGMATAGSGDVLTGIITSLLTQGYDASEAARLGVFVHGLAGDIGAKEHGTIGMIASDIVEAIPEAFLRLQL